MAALFPHLLTVKRNGEVWDNYRVARTNDLLGLVQKSGKTWSATSSITHTEVTHFRTRHDAVWWLIEQYEGDN